MIRTVRTIALPLAAALGLAPLIAGADVRPVDSCTTQSSRTALVCQEGACMMVSPRAVCLAAHRSSPGYARPAALRPISLEEQGRQQLDALIAGIQ